MLQGFAKSMNIYNVYKLLKLRYFMLFFTGFALLFCKESNSFDITHYNYYDNDDFYVKSLNDFSDSINRFNFSLSKKVEWLDVNIPYCAEIYDNLIDCIPNICQTNQDGILYIRQTVGYEGDYCVFHERFVYQGILTCKFKPEENEESLLLLNRFQNGIEFQISDEEFEQMKSFYRKNCDTDLENKYINALMVASDSYDLDLLESNTIFAHEPTVEREKVLIPIKNYGEEDEFDRNFWYTHSISFFDKTYSILLPIVNAIKDRNEDALSQINRGKLNGLKQNLKITSLLYINPLKWSIWINGNKFSSDNNNRNIRVKNIDSRKVNFIWDITNIDTISFNWRENYRYIGDDIFISKDGKNSIKKLNENEYIVEFQLGFGEVFNIDTLLTVTEGIK